jgi:hypothetical protein
MKLSNFGLIAIIIAASISNSSVQAINLTISNPITTDGTENTFGANGSSQGQSFINDPSDSRSVALNTWTFYFLDQNFQGFAAGLVLNIYSGSGNGGQLIKTSTSASKPTSVPLNDGMGGLIYPVAWTFGSGISGAILVANSTYTAVFQDTSKAIDGPVFNFDNASNPNAYKSGFYYQDTAEQNGRITVFDATFTAVPFDFDPSFGLIGLCASWFVYRKLKNRKP